MRAVLKQVTILGFLIMGLTAVAHGQSVQILESHLLDVFVGDKPEYGAVFLARIFDAHHRGGDVVLWHSPQSNDFVEIRVDAKNIAKPENRDLEGIGFSLKSNLFIPLEFRNGRYSLLIQTEKLQIVNDLDRMKNAASFKRPPAPWTRFREVFKELKSYIPSVDVNAKSNFPPSENLASALQDVSPKGPKRLVGLHGDSELALKLGFSNMVLFTPMKVGAPLDELKLAVVNGDQVSVYDSKLNLGMDREFEVNGLRLVVYTYQLEFLFQRPEKVITFNNSHTVQNAAFRTLDFHIVGKIKGKSYNENLNPGIVNIDDFLQILDGKPALTDTDSHPVLELIRACAHIKETPPAGSVY